MTPGLTECGPGLQGAVFSGRERSLQDPPGVRGSLYTDSTALGRMQKYILWCRGRLGSGTEGNGARETDALPQSVPGALRGGSWKEQHGVGGRPRAQGLGDRVGEARGPPSGPESW